MGKIFDQQFNYSRSVWLLAVMWSNKLQSQLEHYYMCIIIQNKLKC